MVGAELLMALAQRQALRGLDETFGAVGKLLKIHLSSSARKARPKRARIATVSRQDKPRTRATLRGGSAATSSSDIVRRCNRKRGNMPTSGRKVLTASGLRDGPVPSSRRSTAIR